MSVCLNNFQVLASVTGRGRRTYSGSDARLINQKKYVRFSDFSLFIKQN